LSAYIFREYILFYTKYMDPEEVEKYLTNLSKEELVKLFQEVYGSEATLPATKKELVALLVRPPEKFYDPEAHPITDIQPSIPRETQLMDLPPLPLREILLSMGTKKKLNSLCRSNRKAAKICADPDFQWDWQMLYGGPLEGHYGWVNSVAWSPDGSRIASGSADRTIRLWDANTGTQIDEHNDNGSIKSVAWSPDGSKIASASTVGDTRLWDANTGEHIGDIGDLTEIQTFNDISWSPDGSKIGASRNKTIILWDANTGKQIGKPITGHTDWVRSVTWSPDGSRLASASDDKTVRLWNANTGEAPRGPKDRDEVSGAGIQIGDPLKGHLGWVMSVAWSPGGSILASAGDDGTIRLWNANTGKQIGDPLTGNNKPVYSVAWHPKRLRLASGGMDKTIRLWDIENELRKIGYQF